MDGTYFLGIQGVHGILRIIRDLVDQHLALHGRGEANYEDIYYLARQLLDGLRGEYENPGLLPLIFDMRTKVSLMAENLNASYGRHFFLHDPRKFELDKLLEDSLDTIEECVTAQLALRTPIVGLGLLDELLRETAGSPLHLVSLNHDTLLETHLKKYEISDGFVKISPDAEEFDPSDFEDHSSFHIRLLKLHGSIDWFRYKTIESKEERVLKVFSNDRDHVKGRDGELLEPRPSRLLLAGTTNKELAYGSGVFIELMFQFQKRLRETTLLIVSGYGFADKGINNRLWAWLDSRPQNRMVVLHQDPDGLRQSAKLSFSSNLDRHKDAGKVVIVDKWMCDCSLEDVTQALRIAATGI